VVERSDETEVAEAKLALRRDIWAAIRDAGAARFPGVKGRIPNFVGAEAAAERLTRTREWKQARVIKCNPDSPQRAVRRAALEAGKKLYMPVPRLASSQPFYELDPERLAPDQLWHASSIKGGAELGRPVTIAEMDPIDLIVTGCVGVSRRGGRLGKGGGYSDLEYAMLRELGLADEQTPIATTVHSVQVVPARSLPMTEHDISLDVIVTPEKTIRCSQRPPRPSGVLWDHLDEDKRDAIPVLRDRREPRGADRAPKSS
jgi:5-formyltetrahydrofolate cyclo-ligase